MKNKEIEELLNEFKKGTLLISEYREKILTYIEQLENNRDKAIEYIENGEILNTWGKYKPFKEFGYGKDLLRMLGEIDVED